MFTIFRGGQSGAWRVTKLAPVKGTGLTRTPALSSVHSSSIALPILPALTTWRVAGVASHVRYTERAEKDQLASVQAKLGRPEATCAALIPIRKSAEWWQLPHDERRAIFEERSRHIAIGRDYLPAVARRLHHCRGLGGPFDFLTWFEYAPEAEPAFDDMLGRLRATEEWCYVEREVDVRLVRVGNEK